MFARPARFWRKEGESNPWSHIMAFFSPTPKNVSLWGEVDRSNGGLYMRNRWFALGRIQRMWEGRRHEQGLKSLQSFHGNVLCSFWRPETPMIDFSHVLDREGQLQLAHTGLFLFSRVRKAEDTAMFVIWNWFWRKKEGRRTYTVSHLFLVKSSPR